MTDQADCRTDDCIPQYQCYNFLNFALVKKSCLNSIQLKLQKKRFEFTKQFHCFATEVTVKTFPLSNLLQAKIHLHFLSTVVVILSTWSAVILKFPYLYCYAVSITKSLIDKQVKHNVLIEKNLCLQTHIQNIEILSNQLIQLVLPNSARSRSDKKLVLRMIKCVYQKDKLYAINTCLLYTSPSPRDKRQSRMPSSA